MTQTETPTGPSAGQRARIISTRVPAKWRVTLDAVYSTAKEELEDHATATLRSAIATIRSTLDDPGPDCAHGNCPHSSIDQCLEAAVRDVREQAAKAAREEAMAIRINETQCMTCGWNPASEERIRVDATRKAREECASLPCPEPHGGFVHVPFRQAYRRGWNDHAAAIRSLGGEEWK